MDVKDIEIINEGRQAQIVLDNIKPIIDELRSESISTMLNEFRNGTNDLYKYVSQVSKLCVFEDIENRLITRINRSRKVKL